MVASPQVRRVIVVVLDGLRADAIPLCDLDHLQRLAGRGAYSACASTVWPSVTAAAMGSLLTGLRPAEHGLTSDRFRVPRPTVPVDPLPRRFRQGCIPSFAFLAHIPRAYRGLAHRLARLLGVEHASFRGHTAPEILDSARHALFTQRRGLFLLHWPDADQAGHAHGWTSWPYAAAARRLAETLGLLEAITNAAGDAGTLLIALSDHGGRGTVFRDHDSAHPHDRTIPLPLIGGAVVHGALVPGSSLLDVPPTVLWALDQEIPPSYAGRALIEAFATIHEAAADRPRRADAVGSALGNPRHF